MIKQKLFKWILKKAYPAWHSETETRIDELEKMRNDYRDYRDEVGEKLTSLYKEIDSLNNRNPNMADLMRDILGLPMVDFAHTDKEGYPPHYMEGLDKDARKAFVGELNAVYRNEKFQTLMNYLFNLFGNHMVRNEKGDPNPARFSMNGLAMIRKELEKAHNEVMEDASPPENFDKLAPLPEDN